MAGTFMTGMALGAGSEVAHQGVRGLMGGIYYYLKKIYIKFSS